MKAWISKEKNIAWLNDNDFGYFYDAFWNPPPQSSPLGYEPELWGWMILE